ncbi:MAG: MBL fold metallo-hydrolase [Phycisphaerae bacterium]
MSVCLTVLGSGTSHGVPMIGCDCAVCTSDDPRDKRTRASAVFSYDGHNVLVDTSPEIRLQCVACGIRRVDAILFTHFHADHIVGLDDVRRFNWLQGGAIALYGDQPTLERLRRTFAYAFVDDPEYPSAKPELHTVLLDGPLELFGRRVLPIPLMHGPLPVFGFRVADIAYCTDCSFIPDESRKLLRDLDVLVLDAVRRRPHATHFNLAQAVAEARRIGARRTYFTHIAHELGHAETNAELPAGMELAYDGLVCESE